MTAASGSAARVTSLWPWWPLTSSRTGVESKSNRSCNDRITKRITSCASRCCHGGVCWSLPPPPVTTPTPPRYKSSSMHIEDATRIVTQSYGTATHKLAACAASAVRRRKIREDATNVGLHFTDNAQREDHSFCDEAIRHCCNADNEVNNDNKAC